LCGQRFSDDRLEDRIETFNWYYRIHKDGRAYTCEFTSKFRITSQRGCNVLFGANPTDGDVNGPGNPFANAVLKRQKSWKPPPLIGNAVLKRRSQSSSVIPVLSDEISGVQVTTKQESDVSINHPIQNPRGVVLHQEAEENITTTPSAASFCQVTISNGDDNASCRESGATPQPMGKYMTLTNLATTTQLPEVSRPSLAIERYLDSPLELTNLEDGDRSGRLEVDTITPSKPRKRRKKRRSSNSKEHSGKQNQPENELDSQYWQYDEGKDGYYHRDEVSNEILWYPVLD